MDIEQGTPEWHAMRSKRLGASDAPAVLGVSAWDTQYTLWLKKTGRKRESQSKTGSLNFAMDRGNRFEPAVRARYELINDIEMIPRVWVHPKYDFLMASTDGDNSANGGLILEVKCAGAEVFNMAKDEGKVHPKYQPQLDQQLMVTGYQMVDFYVARIGTKNGKEQILETALVKYPRNEEKILALEKELLNFWGYVERDEQPPLTDRDSLILDHELGEEKINECESLVFQNEADYLALEEAEWIYKKAQEAHDQSLERLQAFKKNIAHLFRHKSVRIGKVKFTEKTLKNGKKEYGVRLLKSAA